MTSGERMVWAAAFADIAHRGTSAVEAARHAALLVRDMRSLRSRPVGLSFQPMPEAEVVEMIDEMLTSDEERVRSVSQAVLDEVES